MIAVEYKEKWTDIEGYEGLYMVSNLGNVKSLPKPHRYGKKTEIILKGRPDKAGYLRVNLCKDGVTIDSRVHRLTAKHFIPNSDNKPDVNHINGIKWDNKVENLEWVTPKENNQHAWDTGLKKVTDKWLQKMKEVNIGRKHSTESKLKMSNITKEQFKNGRKPSNQYIK